MHIISIIRALPSFLRELIFLLVNSGKLRDKSPSLRFNLNIFQRAKHFPEEPSLQKKTYGVFVFPTTAKKQNELKKKERKTQAALQYILSLSLSNPEARSFLRNKNRKNRAKLP